MLVKFGEGQSGNMNGSYLIEVNVSGAIDPQIAAVSYLSPDANPEFIVRT
jgi:hypothetical protein